MQLAGFSKKLNIHKFKCNGKALEADGLNLRFRKLLETTPAEKAYMDKIKNGTLEKISIEQAKADGLNLTGVISFWMTTITRPIWKDLILEASICFWCIVMWMARTWWQ